MQKYLKCSILGSLASFGVAFVLISTAGAASAQEAPPPAPSSQDEATLGEPQYVERPAPRPDPANELGAAPAPAEPTSAPAPEPASAPAQPAPAPAPAASAPRSPAATARPQAAPARVAARPAAPTPSASAPARATEVQGVQIVRPAVPGEGADAALALTGTTDREAALSVLAGVLIALGWALVRLSRSPRPI